jgi:GDP-L-fucose synthase
VSQGGFTLDGARVWVAGHRGLAGSAIVRRLVQEPIGELLTAASSVLDLRRQADTEEWVGAHRPDVVIVAAARVGGIHANRVAQADFLRDNLLIAANTIAACHSVGVRKLVMLGSSCAYPRDTRQPMREEELLSGPLEPTNEGYAVAKIAALELAKLYRRQFGMEAIALTPTNLYGPDDNFHPKDSHVLPALLRRFHEAKLDGQGQVTLWGTGTPRREFLHADDLADAIIFTLHRYQGEQHLNVGWGIDVTIRELAETIADVVGWRGELRFDPSMPDGAPRKLLDVSRLTALGWQPSIPLREGIADTYRWLCEHWRDARGVGSA